MELNILIFDVL